MLGSHGSLVGRYCILSGLYGGVFGIRFALDVWIFQNLARDSVSSFAFIGITLFGMLLGEVCAGPVSDRVGRRIALHLSVLALAGWACASIAAIIASSVFPLVLGAISFGIGFGVFHTSLDSWFAEAAETRSDVTALELRFTQGYAAYNGGYLVGASLAYPLLLGFEWTASMVSINPSDLHFYPYLLAISALLLITAVLLGATAHPPAIRQRYERYDVLKQVVRDYAAILVDGKIHVLNVVFVAGSIALIVQLIDHLAPAVLLPGTTLFEKSVNIFIFNLTIFVCVGVVQVFLHVAGATAGLRPSARNAIIRGTLTSVVLLLGTCFLTASGVGGVGRGRWIGVLLGIAQALLLILPPLVKAWALEFKVGTLYGTTLAILGVGKRTFAMFGVISLSWLNDVNGAAETSSENAILYGLTMIVALVALLILHRTIQAVRARP